MKISIFADLHINTGTYGGSDKDGLTFRMRDFMDAFKWGVTKNIEEIKPDAVAILGDIYDHPHPPSNIQRFFNSQIRRLNKAGIAVHIVVGNHDACKLHHAIEPLEGIELPNVFVYYTPKIVKLGDKGPDLFIFPHTERVERREISMRDAFVETVKEWIPEIKRCKKEGRQSLLFGHFPIRGAYKSDAAANMADDDVRCEDIDLASPTYAMFGDFHGVQKLPCKTDAMYVGSLERNSFNDMKNKKGFALYDSEGVKTPFLGKNIEFVEYENARPLVLIEGNWDHIESEIALKGESIKDSIVKIQFQGDKSQYSQYDQNKDIVKKAMTASGAKIVLTSAHIEDASRDEAVKKIQEEIQKMGDVEFGDVDKVIRSALEVNSEDPENCKVVVGIAYDIMKTVRERRSTEAGSVSSGTVRIHGVKGHNFQRFGETDNIIEFDQGAAYFLSSGLDGLQQWQKEDFHRKGKSFLEECLSKTEKRIISITGMTDGDASKSNGTGKSTILEMVSYGFYEKRAREYVHKITDREKGKSTLSIMREKDGVIDCREAFVDVLFSVDNSLWLLRRGRQLVGKGLTKHDSILELHCITSDGFVYTEGSHSGHRGEDANKALAELIRMPFETFCNSLLFGQNDAGQFLIGTDKTRKEIIINILQLAILNDYLEEARRRKRNTESDITSLKAQIAVLSEGAEEKQTELSEKLKILKSEHTVLEKSLKDIKEKIKAIDTTEAFSALERAKSNLETKEKAIETKSQEMEKEISRLKEKVDKAQEDKDEKDSSLKAVIKKIEDEKASIEALEKKVSEFPEDKIKKQINLVQSAKKAKPEREAQRNKLQESLNALLPSYGELLGSISEKEFELSQLNILKTECENGKQVQCSKCRQLVGIGHIDAEIIRISSELSVKKKREAEIAKEKEAIDIEAKEVHLKLKNIDEYIDKGDELVRSQQENESTKALIPTYKTRLAEIEKEKLAVEEKVLASSTDLDSLSKELDRLSKDKEKATAPYVADKEKAVEELKKAKEAANKTKEEISKLEEEATEISSNIESKISEKAKTEAGIDSAKAAIEKAKELSNTLEEQYKLLENMKTLDWVFGPDGAQVQIIEKYMPLLNHHLQGFLDIISDGTVRASVVTDGKKEGKVELVISGAVSSITEGLSGGEIVKIRLALDMALGMLSLTRANGSIDSIYIDEAIAAVDVDSKERIFELLDKLQEHFRTVIIISHDPALQDRIKKTIVIDKVDGLSTVKRQFYFEQAKV